LNEKFLLAPLNEQYFQKHVLAEEGGQKFHRDLKIYKRRGHPERADIWPEKAFLLWMFCT